MYVCVSVCMYINKYIYIYIYICMCVCVCHSLGIILYSKNLCFRLNYSLSVIAYTDGSISLRIGKGNANTLKFVSKNSNLIEHELFKTCNRISLKRTNCATEMRIKHLSYLHGH